MIKYGKQRKGIIISFNLYISSQSGIQLEIALKVDEPPHRTNNFKGNNHDLGVFVTRFTDFKVESNIEYSSTITIHLPNLISPGKLDLL